MSGTKRKLYLKADSAEYLEYLKKQVRVSRADLIVNPIKTKFGWYVGRLPNGWQETTARYIAEYLGD